jgi:type 2 lantibiotic biosynthesis protein LanM
MHGLDLRHPSWYRALALTERLALLHEGPETARVLVIDADRAGRRLRRWRDQAPFPKDGWFARRLAVDGLDEDDLRRLLGEPAEAVRDRSPTPPGWLIELDQAFSRPVSAPGSLPETAKEHDLAGFLGVIEPLIERGLDRLREGIEALGRGRGSLPFDRETVIRALYESLPGRLIRMLGGTMALELNVARLRGDLRGDTAEERFRSFVDRIRERDRAVALLQEYPVLARQLVEQVDRWVAFGLEFLGHLCDDLDAIRNAFSPEEDSGPLVGLDCGMGDEHGGGRSVQIAEFRSGLRVVYKPRSMAVDAHFQELLAWLNERGDDLPFRTITILDRGDHGWSEFVTHEGCTSTDEVRRFYRRQGRYLALLDALEATDFHCENLIASGEHPVLVDLEALFHPREERDETSPAGQFASAAAGLTILRIGLLPSRHWGDDETEGVDLSGLGAFAGQLTPLPVPRWENEGTDELRLAPKRVVIPDTQHRPSIDGKPASALDHIEEIEAGFTELYRLLREHQDSLLAPGGVLGRFDDDEIRVILRGTRTYATILRNSFHPDLVRDALERDRFFDYLWREAVDRPALVPVIRAERDDLLGGDVPAFRSRPASGSLRSSAGEWIAGHFREPAMASVRRRLGETSDEDLARHLWILRSSMATLPQENGRPSFRPAEPHAGASGGDFLDAARAIGDRLASLALRSEREAAWIGLIQHPVDLHWSLEPLGLDLYEGLPGVLLFLAHLGALTGEGRYASLAQSGLASLRGMIERDRSKLKATGHFTGWGGLIYTYSHLSAIWGRPDLLAEAEEFVGRLPPLIDQENEVDLTLGLAGCIGDLIGLHRCSPSPRTLEAAVRCGDRILSRSRAMERGIAWDARVAGPVPLAGFAHGAAGIAWALGELSDLTGEVRFREAERAAVAYGHSESPAEEWREIGGIRGEGPNRPGNSIASWCHGAPGIGIARLLSLGRLDDSTTRAEIDSALEATLARGFGDNHSLCHGDLGNLELLLQAGEKLDEPRWRAEAARVGAATLESIRKDGWICGVPSGMVTLGLMKGLAGIGYGLLRLAEPRRVPSVLGLEPPDVGSIRIAP